MPNWCRNKMVVTGSDTKPFEEFLLSSANYTTTPQVEKIVKMVLLGVMGKLKLVDDTLMKGGFRLSDKLSTPGKESLLNYFIPGEFNEQNGAFTQLMELIYDYEELSFENRSVIDDLYVKSGAHAIHWGDIPKARRRLVKPFIKECGFDWGISNSGVFGLNVSDFYLSVGAQKETAPAEEVYGLSFDRIKPKAMINHLAGFNGRLFDSAESGYNFNVDEYGTKWDVGNSIFIEEISNKRIVIEFDTAWSPSVPITEELAQMFPDLSFDHKYSEPGCAFCGYISFTRGEWTGGETVEFHEIWDDETDELIETSAPEYIVNW